MDDKMKLVRCDLNQEQTIHSSNGCSVVTRLHNFELAKRNQTNKNKEDRNK